VIRAVIAEVGAPCKTPASHGPWRGHLPRAGRHGTDRGVSGRRPPPRIRPGSDRPETVLGQLDSVRFTHARGLAAKFATLASFHRMNSIQLNSAVLALLPYHITCDIHSFVHIRLLT